jgi:hypothetical protein
MALTHLQQRFVTEYLADLERNGAAAARRAGYKAYRSHTTASELLHNPEIKQAIEDRILRQVRTIEVNAEMVISGIVESIEKAKSVGNVAWAYAAQLRGYELLGKFLGMWTEKVDVSSDEKLIAALIAGRRRAQGLPPVCDAEEEITEPDTIEEPDTKAKPN